MFTILWLIRSLQDIHSPYNFWRLCWFPSLMLTFITLYLDWIIIGAIFGFIK
jgi:hypothetical protein